MDSPEVMMFNIELLGLYARRPPVTKVTMRAITKEAIKAVRFHKYVVLLIEKFIQKCKPEYKVPALYVINSIIRQSRHEFGKEKDVFAPSFGKNLEQTFTELYRCPPEEKHNIIRVLHFWKKSNVFKPQVIQSLLNMAGPDYRLDEDQQDNNTQNEARVDTFEEKFPDVASIMDLQKRKLLSFVNNENAGERETESDRVSLDEQRDNLVQYSMQSSSEALNSILSNPEVKEQLQDLKTLMKMMTRTTSPMEKSRKMNRRIPRRVPRPSMVRRRQTPNTIIHSWTEL